MFRDRATVDITNTGIVGMNFGQLDQNSKNKPGLPSYGQSGYFLGKWTG